MSAIKLFVFTYAIPYILLFVVASWPLVPDLILPVGVPIAVYVLVPYYEFAERRRTREQKTSNTLDRMKRVDHSRPLIRRMATSVQ